MNKHEILALMMRENDHTSVDVFALVTMLSEQLAENELKLSEGDFARLVSTGAALYQLGLEKYGQREAMDGLFPGSEAWPGGPASRPPRFHH